MRKDFASNMTIQRILRHLVAQNWFAVCIELVVVVIGVFVGIQVANWNEGRLEATRKQQVVEALITDLKDSIGVQQQMVDGIDSGLSEWERSHARGDKPAPYFFRIDGSDKAPNTWGTIQQMQLVDLFDPSTLFDLTFYYSELDGVGEKYIRYVSFVENSVLPHAEGSSEIFYVGGTSNLKPVYRANMERLKEYRDESKRLMRWEHCLVYRLQADRTFDTTCLRKNFVLDGMAKPKAKPMP